MIEELFRGFPAVWSNSEYGRGWNACRDALQYRMEKMEGQWVPKGHIALPGSREEAEMMHLISENYLKTTSQSKESE